MALVTASVTIGFATADSGSAIFNAEVDSRDTGLNGGKTSFAPGEAVWILLYKSSYVTMGPPGGGSPYLTSSGTLTPGATNITVDVEEDISVAYDTSFTTSKPITGPYTITSFSTSTPTFTKQGENTFTCPNKAVFAGRINYKTTASSYKLSNVPLPYTSAVVVFLGDDGKVK